MWAKLKTEWKFEAVIVRDAAGKICGSMGILVRKVPVFPTAIMYAPRGPVCDVHDKAVMEQLVAGAKEIADKHNAYVLRMDTDVKSDDTEFAALCQELGFTLPKQSKNFEGIQPRFVMHLDVEGKTEEEVIASFTQSHRRKVRTGPKKGVEVKICGQEMIPEFTRIMVETGLRDNFVTRDEAYFSNMLKNLGQHCRLYMAFCEGEPIAGTLAIHFGDKVWYLYGASSNVKRETMPNYLLQWEMIRWAIENKCRIYDFRGVSGDLDESNPLYGLYKFKKGFNSELVEFIGEFDLVISGFWYNTIKLATKAYHKAAYVKYILKNKK
jgi:lipid II:glycine glycyltransferase (peptidoglycan interpeptide bridge formation enzyme)